MLHTRLGRVVSLLAVCVGVIAAVPASHAAAHASPQPPSFVDAGGLHVVSATQADPRLWRLQVTTPALDGHTVKINVLLPAGYSQKAATRYPVLYLFHGTSGSANDWLTAGSAEQTTAGLPFITVIPDEGFDADGGGWFSNWVDTTTALGPSQWETYNIDQLIPFVDHDLKTIASRQGRAIAGLSQGGFGSFSLAARHPDLFSTVGAFSGAPDIGSNPVVEAGGIGIIDATEVGLDGGVEPDAIFGSHATNEINYQGHNPGTLVTNLRDERLLLWVGNGTPGPYDSPTDSGLAGAEAIEELVHTSTLSFANVATTAGVPFTLDDYGAGTHSWPYWTRDLQQFVGPLLQQFANPPATPATVDYESVEKTWSQWGWTVANDRTAAQALSRLSQATASGLDLSGTGSATVTTPQAYAKKSAHTVSITPAGGTPTTSVVRADRTGRLVLTVPFAAPVAGASDSTTQVSIS